MRPIKAQLGSVAEHDPRHKQQESIHHLYREPLEQPHGQAESRPPKHLSGQDVHLPKEKRETVYMLSGSDQLFCSIIEYMEICLW